MDTSTATSLPGLPALNLATTSSLPVLSISAVQAMKAEGTGTGTTPFVFTVTRSSSVGTSTVNWAVVHGQTAGTTAGDFAGATSGTVTFASGQLSRQIVVEVVADSVIEDNKNFQVVLSQPVGASLGPTANAAATVVNDDLPAISITPLQAVQTEGAVGSTKSFTFTVSRSSGMGYSCVDYAVSNVNTSADDFSGATTGTVSFAVGQTSRQITIQVKGDADVEADEAFNVVLSKPGSAKLGSNAVASARILNDDIPTLSISADVSGRAEGNSGTTTMTFTVRRSTNLGTSAVNWSVVYPVSGGASASDFTGPTSGSLSFAAGESVKTIAVQVVGDKLIEADESFAIQLSSPTGATLQTATASAVILNDDLPTLSIEALSANKAEGSSGTTPFTFVVKRNSDAGTSAVNYSLTHLTTQSTDFSGATSGTVTFAAGETSKVITVQVQGDTQIEGDEDFRVQLSNPVKAVLGTSTAVGTILNDDQQVFNIVATNASRAEGNSGTTPFTFTVTRTTGLGSASVKWAVSHGTTNSADFSGDTSGVVNFAVGETSKVITLNVVGDTATEADETFSVTLSQPSGAVLGVSSAAGRIANDDALTSAGGITSSVAQVTSFTVPSSVPTRVNNLVAGTKWGGEVGTGGLLTYSFSSAQSVFAYSDPTHTPYTSLNDAQKTAARQAMSAVASLCNLSFVEVADTKTGVGDIRWTKSQNTSLGTAHAYLPSGSGVGGDVWIGPSSWYDAPQVGAYSYQTFIHELGHALGLEHPHDGTPAPVAGEDQLKYSVMSYRDYAGDNLSGYGSSYFPTSYMLNDIAALQYLYGVNASTNAGDNVYEWSPTTPVYQCIWDAGGNDTLSAANQTQGCTLNLNPGTWSSVGTSFSDSSTLRRESLGLAYEVTGVAGVDNHIENAVGSAYADTLIGSAIANTLTGGGGADTLTGGGGADVFRFVALSDGGDTITDFTSGTDKIQVVSANFGALSVGALSASRFVSGTAPAASSADAVFLYNTSTGQLSFDSNGSAAGGVTLLATLSAGYRNLVASDIQVVAG